MAGTAGHWSHNHEIPWPQDILANPNPGPNEYVSDKPGYPLMSFS